MYQPFKKNDTQYQIFLKISERSASIEDEVKWRPNICIPILTSWWASGGQGSLLFGYSVFPAPGRVSAASLTLYWPMNWQLICCWSWRWLCWQCNEGGRSTEGHVASWDEHTECHVFGQCWRKWAAKGKREIKEVSGGRCEIKEGFHCLFN